MLGRTTSDFSPGGDVSETAANGSPTAEKVPASDWEFSDAMAGFPDDRAMALLAARGTNYVIGHEEFYGIRYPGVVSRAGRRIDLREVSRARSRGFEARLYELVRQRARSATRLG